MLLVRVVITKKIFLALLISIYILFSRIFFQKFELFLVLNLYLLMLDSDSLLHLQNIRLSPSSEIKSFNNIAPYFLEVFLPENWIEVVFI